MQNPFSPNLDKISCDAYEKKKKKKSKRRQALMGERALTSCNRN